MQCPVCGSEGCVQPTTELVATLPSQFRPCPVCRMHIRDKRRPPDITAIGKICSCGKRFIDDVFAHIWTIMVEDGDLKRTAPLAAPGSPLIHPGVIMDRPPFLPARSLILLSPHATRATANRLMAEVPEVRGVVRTGTGVPGLSSGDLERSPETHKLLAGCDVRADIVPVTRGPVAIYKQQSLIHIEFPRTGYPKIRSVERYVGTPPTAYFIDACSGAGTLGIAAARLGVSRVVMNDAWYASAFWSAFNLAVNQEILDIGEIRIMQKYRDMANEPVRRRPEKIADTSGPQIIEVYQGDYHELPSVLGGGSSPVTAFDLFEKSDRDTLARIERDWSARIGGQVFIP